MENLNFKKDRYVFVSAPSMVLIGDDVERNKNRQIAMFLNELSSYNVLIKDLVNVPIKENDRNVALNVAYYIISNEEVLRITAEKRDLPISKISRLVKLKAEYLEKCRDYIIAYFIILSNPNYKCIQDYFRIKIKEEDNVLSISNKKEKTHKGLIIKLFRKSAYIITSKGEFFKIKVEDGFKVGETAEGKEKKFFANYKIQISIFLFILIMIGSGIIIQYRTTQSIIVIETTSNIKIHVNKFNKVIYAYSPTDKGKALLSSINPENKNIDEAVAELFEYALKNQMIDLSKKTLITINGQPLKYGVLVKTDKFISENNIPIVINNSGNQQKLPK